MGVAAVAAVALTTVDAAAAGVAGKATFVRGTVQRGANVGGPFEELKRGSRVKEGDVIRTAGESRVELTFGDGSRLRLPSNTTLQVGVNRGSRVGLPSEVTVTTGSIWAQISKAVGSDARFSVRTNNAVAGVRGTTLEVHLDPNGGDTVTLVREGQVVTTDLAGAREAILFAGEASLVHADGSVEKVTAEQVQSQLMARINAMVDPDWATWNTDRDGQPPENIEDVPGAGGKDDTGLKTQEDLSDKSPAQLAADVEGMLNEMRAGLKQSLELIATARRKKDIVRLNCLNDKVTPMKGVIKVAEDAGQMLTEQAGSGDQDGARGSYTKVALARERVSQLKVQAANCVGAESYYGGDTEVNTEINPSLAGENPYFDQPPGVNPAGEFADGPKDNGDNTGTGTPPPPPPSSLFRD